MGIIAALRKLLQGLNEIRHRKLSAYYTVSATLMVAIVIITIIITVFIKTIPGDV